MEFRARFFDGDVAAPRSVLCRREGSPEAGTLVIIEAESGVKLARWPVEALRHVPAQRGELRIANTATPATSRLVITGETGRKWAHELLPGLADTRKLERGQQTKIIGLTTGALVSVILAYIFGVPLLAGQIVGVLPPEWETRLGDTAIAQLDEILEEKGGLTACDPNPDSVANRALAGFVSAAIMGTKTPFDVSITVTRTAVPNAFALPGGRAFYFSALLKETRNADEFAGVMAHEIGHVIHRHGMEQLVASAGTGLLIGFMLGDMTGISVAGAIGTALIDTSFSREAERAADEFAAQVARRLNFNPRALADLLDRVAADDDYSRALALLSTHPLTTERRAALEALSAGWTSTQPAFTDVEWQAIRTMCDTRPPPAGHQGQIGRNNEDKATPTRQSKSPGRKK